MADFTTPSRHVTSSWAFPADDLLDSPKLPLAVGGLIALLALAVFMLWASSMYVSGGAIAAGQVSVEGSRKAVQHRDGGPVRAVFVRDGERVTKGQPLVELDVSDLRADVAVLTGTWVQTIARLVRLRAEARGDRPVVWPSDLLRAADTAELRNALDHEQGIFETRLANYEGKIKLLNGEIEGRRRTIGGLRGKMVAVTTQLASIKEELETLAPLVAKGFVSRPRTIALERSAAALEGEFESIRASVATEENGILQAQVQIAQLEKERHEVIANETADAEARLAETEPRLKSAKEKLGRTTLVAPEAGLVYDLSVFNAGAVLAPGQTVLEIVPEADPLVLSVEINPKDVERVHPGQDVAVHLLAYKQRYQSLIRGRLEKVSADRYEDKYDKSRIFFRGIVRVDSAELLRAGVALSPGMPVQVVIETERRTILGYLLDPFYRIADYGLREQ